MTPEQTLALTQRNTDAPAMHCRAIATKHFLHLHCTAEALQFDTNASAMHCKGIARQH